MAIAFLLLLPSLACAQKLLFLTEDLPPYNFQENNEIKGISVELVLAMLAEAGVDYELKLVPWHRGYQLTKAKKNTFLFSTSRSAGRITLFKWVGPLHSEHINIYKLRSRKDINVRNREDLGRYTLGLPDEDSAKSYALTMGLPESASTLVLDYQALIPILDSGHIDLISLTQSMLEYKILSYPEYDIEDFEIVYKRDKKNNFYVAANKDTDDATIILLNQALKKVIARESLNPNT